MAADSENEGREKQEEGTGGSSGPGPSTKPVPVANPPADPSAKSSAADFLDEEEDVLFQARMKVVDIALGYWKHAVVALLVALLGVGVYGLWQDGRRDAQRDVHAGVAKVGAKITNVVTANPEADPDWKAFGAELEAVARDGTGPAAAWAWIQAGQLYDEAEATEDALRAWAAADAVGAPGMLGWAAASGHAANLVKQEKIDEAAAIYRRWAEQGEGILAEQALYALGSMYREAGRTAESTQAFEQLIQRFPESDLLPQVQQALQKDLPQDVPSEQAPG